MLIGFKRVFPSVLAVFLALLWSLNFARSEFFWAPLTAFAILVAPLGPLVTQVVQRTVWMMIAIILGTISGFYLQNFGYVFISLAVLVLSLGYYYSKKISVFWANSNVFLFALTFSLTLFLTHAATSSWYARIFDVLWGGGIGFLVAFFVFPRRLDEEFRRSLVSLLYLSKQYFVAIFDAFHFESKTEEARIRARKTWLSQWYGRDFPFWVYNVKGDSSLQKGRQFFLVEVEHLGEILLSMDRIAAHDFDPALLKTLQRPLKQFAKAVEILLQAMVTVLQFEVLTEEVSTLKKEVSEIEKRIQKRLPSFELLDLSPDDLQLAIFLQNIKDLQVTLVKMGLALRGQRI